MYLVLGWIHCQSSQEPQEALVLALRKVLWNSQGRGFLLCKSICTAVNPAANTRLGPVGSIKGKGAAVSGSVDSDSVRQRNFPQNYDVK